MISAIGHLSSTISLLLRLASRSRCASFRGDRLDLQQPFAIDGYGNHDRGCRFVTPEHLAANSAVGYDLVAVGQKGIDLDQMLDAEAGGGEHFDDVAPGLLALGLETLGHTSVGSFRHLAADEQQPAMLAKFQSHAVAAGRRVDGRGIMASDLSHVRLSLVRRTPGPGHATLPAGSAGRHR